MTTIAVVTLIKLFMGEGIFRGIGSDKMRKTYAWKDFDYARTVEIKAASRGEFLAILMLSDTASETVALETLRSVTDDQLSALLGMAQEVISKWGGIYSNITKSLKRYVRQLDIEEALIPFGRIASRSKILPIAFPDRYIVLEARVVVTLTAEKILEPPQLGQLCPYLESRNAILSRAKSFAVLARPDYRRDEFLSRYRNWTKQTRGSAYFEHLNLMRMALVEQTDMKPGMQIWDLEMVLFWRATDLVHTLSEAETPALHKPK